MQNRNFKTKNTSAPVVKKSNRSKVNEVKYINNPVFNHKVEQILRAILLPTDPEVGFDTAAKWTHQVSALNSTLLDNLEGIAFVEVGTVKHQGWTFSPDQASLLITLGIKPNVALFEMNRQMVTEFDDDNNPQYTDNALVQKFDKLIMFTPALIIAAYTLAMRYHEAELRYEEYIRFNGAAPDHFAVAGDLVKRVHAPTQTIKA